MNRYNGFVTAGADADFKKPTPHAQDREAAVLRGMGDTDPARHAHRASHQHDSQVIDTRGEVIPGLYCAGESQGGFAQHGLTRCIVFGRLAGRHAARVKVADISGQR